MESKDPVGGSLRPVTNPLELENWVEGKIFDDSSASQVARSAIDNTETQVKNPSRWAQIKNRIKTFLNEKLTILKTKINTQRNKHIGNNLKKTKTETSKESTAEVTLTKKKKVHFADELQGDSTTETSEKSGFDSSIAPIKISDTLNKREEILLIDELLHGIGQDNDMITIGEPPNQVELPTQFSKDAHRSKIALGQSFTELKNQTETPAFAKKMLEYFDNDANVTTNVQNLLTQTPAIQLVIDLTPKINTPATGGEKYYSVEKKDEDIHITLRLPFTLLDANDPTDVSKKRFMGVKQEIIIPRSQLAQKIEKDTKIEGIQVKTTYTEMYKDDKEIMKELGLPEIFHQ